MPRKIIEVQPSLPATNNSLATTLAAELKSDRDFGQPLVYEQEYPTKRARATVIWDEWNKVPVEDRPAIILRAYELALGKEARDRIALANGLTVPEAATAGLLPYQVIAARRETDPVGSEDVRNAMIEQGASQLGPEGLLALRFATQEEAEACIERLTQALPASAPIWIISSDIYAQGSFAVGGSADANME